MYTSIYNGLIGGIRGKLALNVPSYDALDARYFRGIKKSSIDTIVEITGMGQAYANYFMVNQKMNELISKATGLPQLKLEMIYEQYSRQAFPPYQQHKYGTGMDIGLAKPEIDKCASGEKKQWVGFYFRTLDKLIQFQAITIINQDKKQEQFMRDINITGKYAELKAKVLDYISKNEIDVAGELSKDMRKAENPKYEVMQPSQLSHMVFMGRRRLIQFADNFKKHIDNPKKEENTTTSTSQGPYYDGGMSDLNRWAT